MKPTLEDYLARKEFDRLIKLLTENQHRWINLIEIRANRIVGVRKFSKWFVSQIPYIEKYCEENGLVFDCRRAGKGKSLEFQIAVKK